MDDAGVPKISQRYFFSWAAQSSISRSMRLMKLACALLLCNQFASPQLLILKVLLKCLIGQTGKPN